MKKLLIAMLCLFTIFGSAGCGGSEHALDVGENVRQDNRESTKIEETEESIDESAGLTEIEEDQPVEGNLEAGENTISEEDMDALRAIGEVEVDQGIIFVKVTLPAEYVSGSTQESLDAGAGQNYTSAKLNEDGTVTYKLTKLQHNNMMSSLNSEFDNGIQEVINDENNTIVSVNHNDDFTMFDVIVSGTELSMTDSFYTLAFYTWGGTYGIFSGHRVDNVVVNFYDSDGNLINTANSSNMG